MAGFKVWLTIAFVIFGAFNVNAEKKKDKGQGYWVIVSEDSPDEIGLKKAEGRSGAPAENLNDLKKKASSDRDDSYGEDHGHEDPYSKPVPYYHKPQQDDGKLNAVAGLGALGLAAAGIAAAGSAAISTALATGLAANGGNAGSKYLNKLLVEAVVEYV